MGNRYLVASLALALAVLPTAAVEADEQGLSLELGGFAHWLDAPAAEGWSTVAIGGSGRSHPDAEDDVDSWSGGARGLLGAGLPEGMLPAGARVELGGSWFQNDEHATDATELGGGAFFLGPGSAPQFLGFIPVDGRAPLALPNFFIFPGSEIYSEFDAEVRHWDTRLQVSVPVSVSDSLGVKAHLGLVGGVFDQRIQQEQHAVSRFIDCCPDVERFDSYHDLDTEIETWFIGPVLGADVGLELNTNVRFTLGAEVALLYHNADMRMEQSFLSNFGDSPPFRFDTHETDDEDHFNARSRIEGALELDFGLAVLRLFGAFNYWTYAPLAQAPGLPPLFPPNMGPGSGASARLSSGDMMSAELGAAVVIGF